MKTSDTKHAPSPEQIAKRKEETRRRVDRFRMRDWARLDVSLNKTDAARFNVLRDDLECSAADLVRLLIRCSDKKQLRAALQAMRLEDKAQG